ncbi:hypothetical protein [Streptomyces sp. ID05-47C]|uniref:hypothetical protein n=1 Tax=Streptomyces sp. ID05-47C TaxID=3028665 RepID=UPI0029BC5D4E|nr:hypothetical protein [Streptomyces sp. ID05-47C]MDX3570848.1 hypothetical protein [Streptomyces sp. ID05-47C]
MSRTTGTQTADPCPRCRTEAFRPGTPTPAAGRYTAVAHTCAACAHTWSRPIDDDLEPLDTVRVDLPDSTLYGTAWQVEPDRVQVRGSGGAWLRWVERWRVIVY